MSYECGKNLNLLEVWDIAYSYCSDLRKEYCDVVSYHSEFEEIFASVLFASTGICVPTTSIDDFDSVTTTIKSTIRSNRSVDQIQKSKVPPCQHKSRWMPEWKKVVLFEYYLISLCCKLEKLNLLYVIHCRLQNKRLLGM
ncbi:unnamed protein product [Albugo candida]|uniref:Uncharacterized protein n=1 Tax=Albugo candida TaxID=65357 RepID=A0A024G634_9STRA|nr:unnamed protein product [Albugo candida]|eukprot:CCI42128.1 unnamed protein product [Albugo candida]